MFELSCYCSLARISLALWFIHPHWEQEGRKFELSITKTVLSSLKRHVVSVFDTHSFLQFYLYKQEWMKNVVKMTVNKYLYSYTGLLQAFPSWLQAERRCTPDTHSGHFGSV